MSQEFASATTPSTGVSTERRFVTGRAVALVSYLDARGEAVSQIESWLTQPSESEWLDIFGPRALTSALPDTCSFTGGLPGERLEIELRWAPPRPGRRRARHVPAPRVALRGVLTPSPDRVPPACSVFGECGGCQLQHLNYDHQLIWKARRVADALRANGLSNVTVEPAIGSDDPWHYRNHMRFSVDRQGRPGLTARNSHAVLPLRTCPIAHPLINRSLAVLANHPNARPQVLVRCGAATGQVLIQPAPDVALRAAFADAGLVTHDDALDECLSVRSPDQTNDVPHSVEFRIRPSSFFQTNTAQANRMAGLVLGALPTGPHVTLVDAYCGVGTFAALIAPHAGQILAIEESASAVRDARWNLRDAPNVEVVQAKTEDLLPSLAQPIDGLVIDPPRAGCQRPVLDALISRRVPRVVYVSCEPSTLARDLAYLCGEVSAYRISRVQPLDMFPQTAHIETIVTLEAA